MLRRRFFSNLLKTALGVGFLGKINLSSAQVIDLKAFEGDWGDIRSYFPICTKKAYFNCGTMGPSPTTTVEHVINKIKNINETGNYKGKEKARKALADFFKVKTKEICLTHNATEGINIIAMGLKLKEGDEVIMTSHEHVGNALPWLNRAKTDGIKIRVFDTAQTKEENINRLKSLINEKTKAIAIPHVTCTTGTRLPVKEIGELARKHKLFYMIDGAQSAGAITVEPYELKCDFYVGSCHKWLLGPKGTGFLYIKYDQLENIKPIYVGAYSDTGWTMNTNDQNIKSWTDSAHRFDYAMQNAALYVGVTKSLDFLNNIGMSEVERRSCQLASFLYERLYERLIDKIELLTPHEMASRSSIITFKPKKGDYKDLAIKANKAGFRVRQVPEADLGAIRVSTHIFNSFEELNAFTEFLVKYLK